jgi:hypothetical protein
MNELRADDGEWGVVDPRSIETVYDLVREAQQALASGAASSWSADERKAMEHTLDRVRALMQELAHVAGYGNGSDDPRHAGRGKGDTRAAGRHPEPVRV